MKLIQVRSIRPVGLAQPKWCPNRQNRGHSAHYNAHPGLCESDLKKNKCLQFGILKVLWCTRNLTKKLEFYASFSQSNNNIDNNYTSEERRINNIHMFHRLQFFCYYFCSSVHWNNSSGSNNVKFRENLPAFLFFWDRIPEKLATTKNLV